MEANNIHMAAAKRLWNLVRGAWLVLRKGVSKPKLLMLDLNLIFKRGKLAGKNIMHNIMHAQSTHHHRHHHHGAASTSSSSTSTNITNNNIPPDQYEFSCSNTPAHAHKRKHQLHAGAANFFASCSHAPQTSEEEDDDDVIAGQLNEVSQALARSPSVEAFLQSPAVSEMMMYSAGYYSEAPSPALPGFGRTPLARQLRVTDSPFPVAGDNMEEENCQVYAAAEEFIGKFYEQLRKQQNGNKLRN